MATNTNTRYLPTTDGVFDDPVEFLLTGSSNPCCGLPYPLVVTEDGTQACGGCAAILSEPEPKPEPVPADPMLTPGVRQWIDLPPHYFDDLAAQQPEHDEAEAALDDDADAYFDRCAD